jgi:prepilin-type N-terminal cleavage/methylation domain-containing protein
MSIQNGTEVAMKGYEQPQEHTQIASEAAECDAANRRGKAQSGFTIVELLVAVVILAIGVLGLAGTSAVVLQQMNGGNTQQVGSQIAASRFEKMASRKCTGFALSGSRYTRGVTETWAYKAAENNTMVATVTLNIQNRTQPEVYQTVISCF